MRAFVAGATGYVGGHLVEVLVDRGVETVAHVRPDSGKLEQHTERFEALGAQVDISEWTDEAMTAALSQRASDAVFCCIGTTRKRRSKADDPDKETYEAVDYGLTALLVRACVEAGRAPRFVYLSSMGVGPDSMSSYIQARYRAETYVQHSELPYTIARPSFITGSDRPEDRPGERIGAAAADAALTAAGLIGFVGLRDRYKSMSGEEVARALAHFGLSEEGLNEILDARALRGAIY